MRCERPAACALALLLVAGCGDYSNAELEYLNALPTREDLQSNLPEDAAEGGVRLEAEGVLSRALAPAVPTLGMTSKLYEDTRGANQLFKAIAGTFVSLVDLLQRVPPTRKLERRREWGPFAWREHPLFELFAFVERDAVHPTLYTYAFQFRRRGTEDPFVSFVSGHFRAQGAAREGVGSLRFESAVLRDAGVGEDASLRDLEYLAIDYDSFSETKSVALEFQSGIAVVTYAHWEAADGRGAMSFVVDEFMRTLEVTSGWLGTGAGHAVAQVTDLRFGTGTLEQCWDPAFLLTFHESSFEDPRLLGSRTSCPTGLLTP